MWLIPSANAATRGVWRTTGRVGAVLLGLGFARLLGLGLVPWAQLRLVDPFWGTAGALDGNSSDIINDDGIRS